jgi:predicted enzyme related to lactoylglutathione lyase
MGERTSYAPGTFSWAELATSDAEAAKGFYSALFAWEYDDNPIGDGQVYSMARRDGKDVAALFSTDEQPPHWNCYVTVASADDAAARAAELGGQVLAEPFDVMDIGRMAVIADPTGATLCLWEPRTHIGAGLVNVPGALTWNDLVTPDPDAAAQFYGGLFGWTTEEMPGSGGYRVIRNGGRSNGGIMPLDVARMGAETPPSWIPYFGHEDVDRVVAEVAGLGGRVFNGPVRVPAGSFAVIGDPQGAVFAVLTGQYDD